MGALQQIPVKRIGGEETSLADFAGKVLLVVNVASKCGLTPQYDALESLFEHYGDRGFLVLGFPANDFGAQEPGTDEEIANFCSTNFSVAFPMFSKIAVTGPHQHPLYRELIAARPQATAKDDSFRERLAGHGLAPADRSDILWNFEKFLIARDGSVADRFAPDIAPDDPMIVAAIERELAKD